MAETFYIKQGDTSPSLVYTLSPTTDITGASVTFSMVSESGNVKINKAAAAIQAPSSSGIVKYTFTALNTDAYGTFHAEFEVTYADTSIGTFPNDGYLTINIARALT